MIAQVGYLFQPLIALSVEDVRTSEVAVCVVIRKQAFESGVKSRSLFSSFLVNC